TPAVAAAAAVALDIDIDVPVGVHVVDTRVANLVRTHIGPAVIDLRGAATGARASAPFGPAALGLRAATTRARASAHTATTSPTATPAASAERLMRRCHGKAGENENG